MLFAICRYKKFIRDDADIVPQTAFGGISRSTPENSFIFESLSIDIQNLFADIRRPLSGQYLPLGKQGGNFLRGLIFTAVNHGIFKSRTTRSAHLIEI